MYAQRLTAVINGLSNKKRLQKIPVRLKRGDRCDTEGNFKAEVIKRFVADESLYLVAYIYRLWVSGGFKELNSS